MKKIIRKWIGCHSGETHWRYGRQNHNTISGQLTYEFWSRVERVREWPFHLRGDIANRLSWLAAKLRGHRNYDLGHGIEGNLAAMLADTIRTRCILSMETEEWTDLIEQIDTLESLAKADFWHAYEKIEREYAKETSAP